MSARVVMTEKRLSALLEVLRRGQDELKQELNDIENEAEWNDAGTRILDPEARAEAKKLSDLLELARQGRSSLIQHYTRGG